MMKWVIVSEEYLLHLRSKEPRIPKSEYGIDKFKPFFGVLFETEDFYYVTQVSSPKERHIRMKQNIDFYKIYDKKENGLLAVINLNYMFPVPKNKIKDLQYSEIEKYRKFSSEKQKSQYIHFLKMEMKQINKLNVGEAAERIFELKRDYPNNAVSQRCIDFQEMEVIAKRYMECM